MTSHCAYICGLIFLFCTSSCALRKKNVSEPAEEENSILSDSDLPVTDVLEDGFCSDDIYGTYLRDQYMQKHSYILKRYKNSRSRRKRKRRMEFESMFHARSQLVGPLSPYYGALPVAANHEVEFWMQYFKTRGRSTFIKWLVRAESYKSIVESILRREGMPPEFLYLAMVESGFSNTAYSRMRATGTWQFMKGTARLFGLKMNYWVDERRDPVKSTVAAAKYLKHLYQKFGDWYLAMAAYNAGPGKVRRAIRKTGTRDFWKINKTRYLRMETKHYVPKVLAALNLATHKKQHGFDVSQSLEYPTPQTTVHVPHPIQINELARKLGVSSKTMRGWNPEIIRGITPPNRGKGYHLRLPETYVSQFHTVKDKLSIIEVTDVLMHRVRKGDTLYRLSRKYKVNVSQIRKMNPRLRAKALRIGKNIAIPVPGIVKKRKG